MYFVSLFIVNKNIQCEIQNLENYMQNSYDYIIAGAGLAGLSLAYKIKQNPSLSHKTILLVDKDKKQKNDRTWCFWSQEDELFESIIYNKWSTITFAANTFQKRFNILPYTYKMIRGLDFYNHVIPFLKKSSGVDFVYEPIQKVESNAAGVLLKTKTHDYKGKIAFKSYYEKEDFTQDHFVWQHFKGIVIKADNAFDPSNAQFMDFRVPQDDETRFFYVLPFSKNEALVEIAIFSKAIPSPAFYDPYINDYLKNMLGISNYEIIEEELGAIPMTTFDFQKHQTPNIIKIGTNGGSVKASSGYAFKRIQEETDNIITCLVNSNISNYKPRNNRFSFYDKIMLNAILSGKTTGEIVFTKLFKKLRPQTIFKFLDEKGTIINDIKIFTAPPTLPFLKGFIEEIKLKLFKT